MKRRLGANALQHRFLRQVSDSSARAETVRPMEGELKDASNLPRFNPSIFPPGNTAPTMMQSNGASNSPYPRRIISQISMVTHVIRSWRYMLRVTLSLQWRPWCARLSGSIGNIEVACTGKQSRQDYSSNRFRRGAPLLVGT